MLFRKKNSNFISCQFKVESRLVHSVGDDLVTDETSAIIELIKNSYDADANNVTVAFSVMEELSEVALEEEREERFKQVQKLKISILDDGHGMDAETFVDKWMVVSTSDKPKRRNSPSGRKMLGRKGIGRFFSAILGEQMLLETVDEVGIKTIASIDWEMFKKERLLENVVLKVATLKTNEMPHTKIEIVTDSIKLMEWDHRKLDNLIYELQKFLNPLETGKEIFNLYLNLEDFHVKYPVNRIKIEPLEIVDIFDYRIHGSVSDRGKANFHIETFSPLVTDSEAFEADVTLDKGNRYCGTIHFDLRVVNKNRNIWKKLPESLRTHPISNKYIEKDRIENLVNYSNSVLLYRGGFRIKPYGDMGNGWLKLNKLKEEYEDFCIYPEELFGFITIAPEEFSHLIEKTSRNGLKENKHYRGFLDTIGKLLVILNHKILNANQQESEVEKLESIPDTRITELQEENIDLKNVEKTSTVTLIDKQDTEQLGDFTQKIASSERLKREHIKKEIVNSKQIEEYKETLDSLIFYYGEVATGNITKTVINEIRNPLKVMNDSASYLSHYTNRISEKFDANTLNKILELSETFQKQSRYVMELITKLETLNYKKKFKPKILTFKDILENVHFIFKGELERNGIDFVVDCTSEHKVRAVEGDIMVIISNFIQGSINSLVQLKDSLKYIKIIAVEKDDKLFIDFIDNSLEIYPRFILNPEGDIAKSDFSSVRDSVGLGLYMTQLALYRNEASIEKIGTVSGNHFRCKFPKVK
ncbi:MAG: sensor histidine kinase [Leptospiraceae bacterium]|nr:sensor histidine kinase [Leptospiraceae bacterium]MCP5492942.1 sensor histidine kinase [Leptospiraceae bacterium]